tara:strand:+ start:12742 stop:13134 length:393 start_codon:yes stop_codon:yes gene_type:complete
MIYNNFDYAINVYIEEFQKYPNKIEKYKINFLKNYFYYFVEKYIDVDRENLLIGCSTNKKFLYFKNKFTPDMHFVYNLNNPSCNYLKFDYPIKFVETLNSDELHYKKYKTQILIKKELENYKPNCECIIL